MLFIDRNSKPRHATSLVSVAAILAAGALSGCATLGASGPTASDVSSRSVVNLKAGPQISVIRLDENVARRVAAASRKQSFSDILGDGIPFGAVIGEGDVISVSIWEAPPAILFSSGESDPRKASSGGGSGGLSLPEQMVDPRGRVNIPFVGSLRVAGQTPAQIEADIVTKLSGIAHRPQVILRVVMNATDNVTVVGDIANSARIPLTPKGERLLDIIAAVGGVKQPVGKTMIQVSRGRTTAALPLEQIINDPSQNIRLQADDVVTALFQPFSFTSLGAIGVNAEIPFEATGITLAQALGRMGGLRDDRADVKGVFVFRLEDPAALDTNMAQLAPKTPDGKVAVIYRVDMKDPANFFVAQGFPIRNKDVVYVSNAPGTDLQKFINIISSMAFSVIGISNSL